MRGAGLSRRVCSGAEVIGDQPGEDRRHQKGAGKQHPAHVTAGLAGARLGRTLDDLSVFNFGHVSLLLEMGSEGNAGAVQAFRRSGTSANAIVEYARTIAEQRHAVNIVLGLFSKNICRGRACEKLFSINALVCLSRQKPRPGPEFLKNILPADGSWPENIFGLPISARRRGTRAGRYPR